MSFLTVPGVVLLLCLLIYARAVDEQLFLNRLGVGTLAGAVGLATYDLSRWLTQTFIVSDFDAFRPILGFGALITGAPMDSNAAALAGWGYHISNGWTFALVYALVVGPGRWWLGLVMGAGLEAGMVIVYPVLFTVPSYEPFLMVSIIGHTFYGAAVGLVCQHRARYGR